MIAKKAEAKQNENWYGLLSRIIGSEIGIVQCADPFLLGKGGFEGLCEGCPRFTYIRLGFVRLWAGLISWNAFNYCIIMLQDVGEEEWLSTGTESRLLR